LARSDDVVVAAGEESVKTESRGQNRDIGEGGIQFFGVGDEAEPRGLPHPSTEGTSGRESRELFTGLVAETISAARQSRCAIKHYRPDREATGVSEARPFRALFGEDNAHSDREKARRSDSRRRETPNSPESVGSNPNDDSETDEAQVLVVEC
jgi:hypothetical protein